MDADLLDWDTHFVPGLLGPLLSDPDVALVKGFYRRPFLDGSGAQGPTGDDGTGAFEGGRVTELVARPLIALVAPHLSGLVQPLAGEWAVRRRELGRHSVPTGYAVELAALLDVALDRGTDAIAQVDLGRRAHRHQALLDLGAMATQIMAAVQVRVDAGDLDSPVPLRQFHPVDLGVEPVVRPVPVDERPPAERFWEGGR
jgi:glucosyl-3-phosphoglycerate synthase